MNYFFKFFLSALCYISIFNTNAALSAAQSTDSSKLHLSKKTPKTASIITKHDDCYDSGPFTFSTSWTFPSNAHPFCKENYIMKKIDFHNRRHGLDIDTQVTFHCCKQETFWG